MKMKKFLALLLLVVFSLAVIGCSQNNAGSNNTSDKGDKGFEKITIALGHGGTDSDKNHLQQFSLKFKEEVEKATDGNVTIEIHPNNAMGGEREMTEAVQLGTLDMTLTSTGPVGNFASKSNVLDFPFIFTDANHAHKVLDGEVGAEIAAQLDGQGIHVLTWAENGFRQITNSKRPIKSPADLKGLKIRTMENKIHIESFKSYGASSTPMAFSELFTSLQQGVVDGQENPLPAIISAKFDEVQKYMSISNHFYSACPLLINKQKFDSFSPELQKVLTDAAAVARDYQRQFIQDMNAEYIKTAQDRGMAVVLNNEVDQAAFVKASQPVYDKFGPEYADLIKKIEAAK